MVIDAPDESTDLWQAFEKGAVASGGETAFHVADAVTMPPVETDVVFVGEDNELARWLADHGIRTRAFDSDVAHGRRIDIGFPNTPTPKAGREAFQELARRIGRGSGSRVSFTGSVS